MINSGNNPKIKIANKLKPIPNQFLADNFSLKTSTDTKVEMVKMLKLFMGNNAEGSSTFEFKAKIIKYIVPKLMAPNMIPAGMACN